jgi:hypothetical protein
VVFEGGQCGMDWNGLYIRITGWPHSPHAMSETAVDAAVKWKLGHQALVQGHITSVDHCYHPSDNGPERYRHHTGD